MKIDSLCVKPSGEALILNEDGQQIASGVLSRPALHELHLQVLLALLRGANLSWEQVQNPGEHDPPLL
jgi:hypothetical protein